MTDEQTAAAIVADPMNAASETAMEAAIVRALQAARTPHAGHIIDEQGVVRRVLGTFDTTKDGAVVVGKVELWHPKYPKAGRVGTWLANGGTCRFYFPNASGTLNTWNDVPISECYSTREAAEAAKEASK